MKRFFTYLILPVLTLAASCAKTEPIDYAHEQQAFQTRSDKILLEVIMPQASASTDEIYIVGAFNGGEAAIGNASYLMTHSETITSKWGIYLDPAQFQGGKTLADGFTFYNVEQGYERSSRNEAVSHTLTIGAGQWANVYADKWEKYFLPVSKNNAFQVWQIRPDSLARIRMLEAILHCVELHRDEPRGYEFDLRTSLCSFWCGMLDDSATVRANAPERGTADTERMKRMMDYIHNHCSERLTLDDIADSANVSRRECTRCFRRCIDSTPNEYLNACRVRMAADLLHRTGKSVLDISEECGFSSSSYFGKVFREAMGVTPKDYRKQIR